MGNGRKPHQTEPPLFQKDTYDRKQNYKEDVLCHYFLLLIPTLNHGKNVTVFCILIEYFYVHLCYIYSTLA